MYPEAGAAAQNAQLVATAMGLGAVLVGGFDDARTAELLRLPEALYPVALICAGVCRCPE